MSHHISAFSPSATGDTVIVDIQYMITLIKAQIAYKKILQAEDSSWNYGIEENEEEVEYLKSLLK